MQRCPDTECVEFVHKDVHVCAGFTDAERLDIGAWIDALPEDDRLELAHVCGEGDDRLHLSWDRRVPDAFIEGELIEFRSGALVEIATSQHHSIHAYARLLRRVEPIHCDLLMHGLHSSASVFPADDRGEWVAFMVLQIGRANRFESPLEAIFYAHWRAKAAVDERFKALEVIPQVEVCLEGKQYRLDFAVHPFTRDIPLARASLKAGMVVVVELDGHEFHERTKEQVASRNARDRAIQREGFSVCHYSGSELVRDPWKCVEDVYETAIRRRLHQAAEVLGFADVKQSTDAN